MRPWVKTGSKARARLEGQAQGRLRLGQEKLQSALKDIAEYAKSKPSMALGAALGTGLLIGQASGRSKRTIFYIKHVKPSEVR